MLHLFFLVIWVGDFGCFLLDRKAIYHTLTPFHWGDSNVQSHDVQCGRVRSFLGMHRKNHSSKQTNAKINGNNLLQLLFDVDAPKHRNNNNRSELCKTRLPKKHLSIVRVKTLYSRTCSQLEWLDHKFHSQKHNLNQAYLTQNTQTHTRPKKTLSLGSKIEHCSNDTTQHPSQAKQLIQGLIRWVPNLQCFDSSVTLDPGVPGIGV